MIFQQNCTPGSPPYTSILQRLGFVSKRELATGVEGSNVAFPRPEASAYGSDAYRIHVLKQSLEKSPRPVMFAGSRTFGPNVSARWEFH